MLEYNTMIEKNSIRNAYDNVAESYASVRSESGQDIAILAEFLEPLSADSKILDAGCGQGTPVLRQVNETATAVGLDFSREQLRLATENVPGGQLVQGDLTHLPVADDVFDAITAYHTLIHIPLDAHQTVLTEFGRVLRPGGRLLLTESPTEWTGANPDWLDTGVEMQWNMAGAETTREQLRNAGFTIFEEWEVNEDEHWMFFAAELTH